MNIFHGWMIFFSYFSWQCMLFACKDYQAPSQLVNFEIIWLVVIMALHVKVWWIECPIGVVGKSSWKWKFLLFVRKERSCPPKAKTNHPSFRCIGDEDQATFRSQLWYRTRNWNASLLNGDTGRELKNRRREAEACVTSYNQVIQRFAQDGFGTEGETPFSSRRKVSHRWRHASIDRSVHPRATFNNLRSLIHFRFPSSLLRDRVH